MKGKCIVLFLVFLLPFGLFIVGSQLSPRENPTLIYGRGKTDQASGELTPTELVFLEIKTGKEQVLDKKVFEHDNSPYLSILTPKSFSGDGKKTVLSNNFDDPIIFDLNSKKIQDYNFAPLYIQYLPKTNLLLRYVRWTNDGYDEGGLYLVKEDLSAGKVIADFVKNYWPSPDGKKIIIQRKDKRVFLIDLLGGKTTELMEEKKVPYWTIENFVWSADGEDVIFQWSERKDIAKIDKIVNYVYNLSKNTIEAIPSSWNGPNYDLTYYHVRSWSPDKKTLAAIEDHYDMRLSFVLINSKGQTLKKLKEGNFAINSKDGYVDFSPDGRYVSYEVDEYGSSGGARRGHKIYVFDIKSGKQIKTIDGTDAKWLPAGTILK